MDAILLPYLREFEVPAGNAHAYLCPVVQDIPGVIKTFFAAAVAKILSPEIGLAEHLVATSEQEIVRLANRLGIGEPQAREAWRAALAHQAAFEKTYRKWLQAEISRIEGPVVVLVGRPYAAFASDVNLTVPRKIASRGFNVVPGDGLPFVPPEIERNVWHFTQQALSAVEYARTHEEHYICAIS